jgi:D-beta-D-heptose 7-phosphate kinase/D-beta-D-heptose 1-phosphate adenosyltransferase
MFQEARKLGDNLLVIINNDNWLKQKKGYVFMPQEERAEIIKAFDFVTAVCFTGHGKHTKDMSVCRELDLIRPDIFANGGDRKRGNIPEVALCKKFGIKMVFNVGKGGKVQSSSDMVKKASKHLTK